MMVKKRGNKVARKKVEITCPECDGHGGHDIAQVCPTCNDQRTIFIWKTRRVGR